MIADANRKRIGLALSGGGFRATLFHLGLIRFLRDAGVLSSVTHITSVSGGSVLAAHLVLNWDRYTGTPDQFDTVAAEVIKFTRLDVRNRILRRAPLALPLHIARWVTRMQRDRRLTRTGMRGCTWTWRVEDGAKQYDIVVIGSPNVNPGFQLVNNKDYPEIATDFAKTFATLKSLPCDVFLGAHGGSYGMVERYDLLSRGQANAFVNPEDYKKYVARKEQAFRQTLALQQGKADLQTVP